MLGKYIDTNEVYPIYTIENEVMVGRDNIPLAISEEEFVKYQKVIDEFWTFQDKLEKIYYSSRKSI